MNLILFVLLYIYSTGGLHGALSLVSLSFVFSDLRFFVFTAAPRQATSRILSRDISLEACLQKEKGHYGIL
jgi:hypothetical protein